MTRFCVSVEVGIIENVCSHCVLIKTLMVAP